MQDLIHCSTIIKGEAPRNYSVNEVSLASKKSLHSCYSGLEIATDKLANATKTFNLATKNLSLVATFSWRLFCSDKEKIKGEKQFPQSCSCFSAKVNVN